MRVIPIYKLHKNVSFLFMLPLWDEHLNRIDGVKSYSVFMYTAVQFFVSYPVFCNNTYTKVLCCFRSWVLPYFPAIGFNVETVQYKNLKFQVWDLGGQTSIR